MITRTAGLHSTALIPSPYSPPPRLSPSAPHVLPCNAQHIPSVSLHLPLARHETRRRRAACARRQTALQAASVEAKPVESQVLYPVGSSSRAGYFGTLLWRETQSEALDLAICTYFLMNLGGEGYVVLLLEECE